MSRGHLILSRRRAMKGWKFAQLGAAPCGNFTITNPSKNVNSLSCFLIQSDCYFRPGSPHRLSARHRTYLFQGGFFFLLIMPRLSMYFYKHSGTPLSFLQVPKPISSWKPPIVHRPTISFCPNILLSRYWFLLVCISYIIHRAGRTMKLYCENSFSTPCI